MPTSDYQELIQQQAQYAFHSARWMADTTGFICNDWQAEASAKYDNDGHLLLSTGSGVGKTAFLANAILHFLATRPECIIPCTAPSEHQFYDVLWAEIKRWMNKSALLSKMFTWTAERIYFNGMKETWFAVARTSSPKPGAMSVEGLQGFHAEHLLFVVDEVSGVADQVMGAVDGAMSTPNARAILATNPTRNTGYAYRIMTIPALQELWKVMYVDAEKVDEPYVDKAAINRLKIIYGEDSDYFRMRVRGLPPRTEFNSRISPEQVYAAHERILEGNGHKFLSIDCARFGPDNSVFYLRDGNKFLNRAIAHGLDTMEVAKVSHQISEGHDIEEIRVDVGAMGAGVIDKIKLDLPPHLKKRVISINAGSDAFSKEEFINLRSEMLWNVGIEIDNVSIPFATPLLDQELPALRYGWDPKDKRIRFEAKNVLRTILHRSPDDADSFAMNVANLGKLNKIQRIPKEYFDLGRANTDASLGAILNGDNNVVNVNPRSIAAVMNDKSFSAGIGINRFRIFKGDLGMFGGEGNSGSGFGRFDNLN